MKFVFPSKEYEQGKGYMGISIFIPYKRNRALRYLEEANISGC